MKIKTVLFLFLGTIALVRADQTIESVQQMLKEQGFYYGEITGEKNSETTAAIRRYQIRNGLPVTGELDEATSRSLRNSVAPSPSPAATDTPSAPDAADLRDNTVRESNDAGPAAQPFITPGQTREPDQRDHQAPPPSLRALFAGTPYETSTPDAQRNVIASAQRALAQRETYRHEINGIYGPDLEFSLRAYQSRVGLAVSGRLDLATLAALELLPGANTPVYIPRKPSRARDSEPPVRGEWIHQ